MLRKLSKYLTVGTAAILATLTLSSLLLNFSVFATTSTGNSRVAVTLSDIITLHILDSSASSEISNLMLDVTPTPNGAFTKNSMIVEAATSNPTGYKLYMSSIGTNPVSDTGGSSNASGSSSSSGASSSSGSSSNLDSSSSSSSLTYTTDLINVNSDITDSIPTLDTGASVTEADFRVRNSSYKNKWGYSLADLSITDTNSITYTNIPEHSTNHEIGGNTEASDSDLTPVTIGVNVSSSIASGTYKNKLEFTAIANPIPKDFTLSFDKNTEDVVENLPETMSASSVGPSYTFTIPNTIPSRTGYVLQEYNTEFDGTGDVYQPGDDFAIVSDDSYAGSTSKTLYAIWAPAEKWQLFLGKGGFNPLEYDDFNTAMQVEEINTTIFENQSAMTYLIENEDLLAELKQTESYSESSVPNLLASSLYTDVEKYNYGLPFYLFDSGPTGIIDTASTEFKSVYYGIKSHSAYMDDTVFLSLSAFSGSCSSQMLWFDGTITTAKYVNMGIYVSSRIVELDAQEVMLSLTAEPEEWTFMEWTGGKIRVASLGRSVMAIEDPSNNYYPKARVWNCASGAPTTYVTNQMTITKWWFE